MVCVRGRMFFSLQGYADVSEAPADTLLSVRTADAENLCTTVGQRGSAGGSVSGASSGLIPRTFDMLFEVGVLPRANVSLSFTARL